MSAVQIKIGKKANIPNNTLVRAFVALDFDKDSRNVLEALVTALRSSAAPHILRWTSSHQFHVTLKFLGNIDEGVIRRIIDESKIWSRSSLSFHLSVTSLTAFPSPQTAKYIVATLNDPGSQLEKLARQIDTFLGTIGVATVTRRLIPHVTLATAQVPFDARNWLAMNTLPSFMHELTCPTLTLYRSDLTSNGTVYTPIIQRRFITDASLSKNAYAVDSKYRAKQWYLDSQKDLKNTPKTTNKVNSDYNRRKSHI